MIYGIAVVGGTNVIIYYKQSYNTNLHSTYNVCYELITENTNCGTR